MGKHTPGPWGWGKWEAGEFGNAHPVMVVGRQTSKHPIAVITQDADSDDTEADAWLMAAAPDLLALVREIAEVLGEIDDADGPPAELSEWPADVLKRARAAIAEATTGGE